MPPVSSNTVSVGRDRVLTHPQAAIPGRVNHVVNHIGITVPDLDTAIKFYSEVLGFRPLRSSAEYSREKDPCASLFRMYGDSANYARVAWLAAGNGVGIELFDFKDPKYNGHRDSKGPGLEGMAYNSGGMFHLGVTHPNPEELCAEIVKAGGKKIGETVKLYDGDTALYVTDPWGTIIEVLSCSMEGLMANRD
jgi:catechol 2,3-dioxygenase-like lactoylglutathione lyase family enzyme